METIKIDIAHALNSGVGQAAVDALLPEALAALDKVEQGTGAGNDYLGWVKLPSSIPADLLNDIAETAKSLREKCEVVVAIGIGGSFLGAKAVVEALSDSFAAYKHDPKETKLVFAGQNIGEDYLFELMRYLEGKKFGIIVISKSGTTTEPAIAFRLLSEMLEREVGKEKAAERIVAITDPEKGALRTMADAEGYKTFEIAGNIGGRFSVLTPVGLLPIAVAGYDIKALVGGAAAMEQLTGGRTYADNVSLLYAAMRNALYRSGKKIEILVDYNPKLHYIGEWWKQLYGESEGKDGKGIFPASVDNSTDLHSMGQWIQDGERTIFETVISVKAPKHTTLIPTSNDNLDGLNYIAGKRVDEVNKMAELGTRMAHVDGGVPNMQIEIPALTEEYIGQLIYFFEKACGISGYMLGVNPFNQPGVEAYKKNMFKLLKKPGY